LFVLPLLRSFLLESTAVNATGSGVIGGDSDEGTPAQVQS
jgi:hypothetical protein